jgi:hypothetical protein
LYKTKKDNLFIAIMQTLLIFMFCGTVAYSSHCFAIKWATKDTDRQIKAMEEYMNQNRFDGNSFLEIRCPKRMEITCNENATIIKIAPTEKSTFCTFRLFKTYGLGP